MSTDSLILHQSEFWCMDSQVISTVNYRRVKMYHSTVKANKLVALTRLYNTKKEQEHEHIITISVREN